MVTILKHGKTKQNKHYKTKCACGCEFEFYSEDIHIGACTGKEYVVCPECFLNIYKEWFKWKKIK